MARCSTQVYFLFLVVMIIATSCASLNNASQYQLHNDYFEFRQPGNHYAKAFIKVEADSISILPVVKPGEESKPIQAGKDMMFLKRSFDIDVLVVPFKYRPPMGGLPRQLNTDFNGNFFLGYRWDHFQINTITTPAGIEKKLQHRAITLGGFGGIGSSAINPSTTQNKSPDEYNALILSRGLAVMFGVNNLTVGVGLGWDYLSDRDKKIWIYQNKPWLGLTLSLNLN